MHGIKYFKKGPGFRRAHKKMENKVKELHEKRKTTKEQHKAQEYEMAINKEIGLWNSDWPKAENYLDLHWATVDGALDLVARRTAGTYKRWYLETGVGNHSNGHFPAIKMALREKYGTNIAVHDENKGILILKVKSKK